MKGIFILSYLCILCTLSAINAANLNKNKDSKISHIQMAAPSLTVATDQINDELKYNINNKDKFLKKYSVHSQRIDDGQQKHVISNHEVLKSLGLSRMKVPSSHHRKRLAVESRHHGHPDDSHMFIIKLPPNQAYYSNIKSADGSHDKNSINDKNQKVSVDFKSNGKPGRIYHWNLPTLKKKIKTESGRQGSQNLRNSNDIDELIDIRHIPTWSKPWENETVKKNFNIKSENRHEDKMFTNKSPSYYVPTRPKKNSLKSANNTIEKSGGGVHKYFSGNGKPQSFYVIKKKSRNTIPHYQKLITY